MKILNTISEKTIEIKGFTFTVEIKKVIKSNVVVKSADKRAGTYIDNFYKTTVAFVNGQSYMTCNCLDSVIEELNHGGYKFFTS